MAADCSRGPLAVDRDLVAGYNPDSLNVHSRIHQGNALGSLIAAGKGRTFREACRIAAAGAV